MVPIFFKKNFQKIFEKNGYHRRLISTNRQISFTDMKNLLFLAVSICFAVALPTQIFSKNEILPCPDGGFPMLVTMLAGTPVKLELAEKIESHKMKEGRLVQFVVRGNVVVKTATVIRHGAVATGRVKSITRSTYSTPESIILEVIDVQAADGQTVALAGIEQEFAAEWPNEPVSVSPGELFTSNTMNTMEIEVEK